MIDITIGGLTVASASGSYSIGAGTPVTVNAVAGSGWLFSEWGPVILTQGFIPTSAPNTFAMNGDYDLTAVFVPAQPVTNYHITATSDSRTSISPSGVSVVPRGGSQTFYFSGQGYVISSVTVDGVPLTRAQINLGYYTFTNVMSNHTIDVIGSNQRTGTSLTITVSQGSGRAEYSVNGGPFTPYSSSVTLPDNCDLVVRAYADSGYSFARWETPATKTTSEIEFDDLLGALSLRLYFASGGGSMGTWNYITATSDSKTSISPSGVSAVQRGGNQTFYFSGQGYAISSVTVDGVPLTGSQIALGYYTFTNVMSNHTIDIIGSNQRTGTSLTIAVSQGSGHAEYSVNGGPFTLYVSSVTLPDSCDLVVRAYADSGYSFARWETPATKTTSEIEFDDLLGALSLRLYFASGG